MGKKLTYEYVKGYFKKQGCELLEEEYKNVDTKMRYICECGDISEISFDKFKQGRRCKKCGIEKMANTKRLSFQYVYDFFKKYNCELLEKTYKNANTPIKYKCACGNISKISFDSFRRGARCFKCGVLKHSGKNHPNYNPKLTDEEREENKNRHGDFNNIKWRKEVYERDNYTCPKCSQRGGILNAHHIANWADNKELRFILPNGITMCKNCHNQFHKKYGKRNNNKTQLDEFLNLLTA